MRLLLLALAGAQWTTCPGACRFTFDVPARDAVQFDDGSVGGIQCTSDETSCFCRQASCYTVESGACTGCGNCFDDCTMPSSHGKKKDDDGFDALRKTFFGFGIAAGALLAALMLYVILCSKQSIPRERDPPLALARVVELRGAFWTGEEEDASSQVAVVSTPFAAPDGVEFVAT